MVNRNIDLPSKREKDTLSALVNEIEGPLRRDFKYHKHNVSRVYDWMIVILFLILLTGLYLLVAGVVDNQAKQAVALKKAMAAEVDPLCTQYLNDSKLSGTAAAETLKTICTD